MLAGVRLLAFSWLAFSIELTVLQRDKCWFEILIFPVSLYFPKQRNGKTVKTLSHNCCYMKEKSNNHKSTQKLKQKYRLDIC